MKRLFFLLSATVLAAAACTENSDFGAAPTGMAFTAGPVTDDDGPNDAADENDLTGFEWEINDDGDHELSWSWDEPTVVVDRGRANGCGLFDSNSDGGIDVAFCVEVVPDPVGDDAFTDAGATDAALIPALIRCDGEAEDRCARGDRPADAQQVDLGPVTSCAVAVEATDPFIVGGENPDDLVIRCMLDGDLVPVGAGVVNVCSYPSADVDGNAAPVDCVVTPQVDSGDVGAASVPSRDASPDPALTVSTSAASAVTGPGLVDYTVTATNAGNLALTGITVTDSLIVELLGPDGDVDGNGSLDVDETWTWMGVVDLTQADIDASDGRIINAATVTSTETGPMTAEHTLSVIQSSSLAIVTSTETSAGVGDGVLAVEGEAITWRYEVSNTGTSNLAGVEVVDDVGGLICTVDVAVGESATCEASGVAEVGEFTNSAEASVTVDGATVSASDHSGYAGIDRAQPAISQTDPEITVTGPNSFSGTMTIAAVSDVPSGDPATVYISAFEVGLAGSGASGDGDGTATATCTFEGQPSGVLQEFFVFDAEVSVAFQCETASRLDGSYTVTVRTELGGEGDAFIAEATLES